MPEDLLELPNTGADATQEHPDELQDSDDAPAYGERNEDLPEQLQNALKALIQKCQKQEMYDRRVEIMKDWRNRLYELGHQHIYEGANNIYMQANAGGVASVGGREIQFPSSIKNYNIFQPYLRTIEAVLTQNSPGIDFRPNNPNRTEDMEASQTAEGYRKLFDRANDVKKIQLKTVRMLALSGRTIRWTRTEASKARWGLNQDGAPKQMETTTVYGTIESKLPILAKCLEDCSYVGLSDDPDLKVAKQEYPKFADKIKLGATGVGENEYERVARLGILQGARSRAQIGEAWSHLVTRQHWWLRPAIFQDDALTDEFEDNPQQSVQEALESLFPNGVHCVYIGEQYVGSWDEAIEDALSLGFPYEQDGMSQLAIMDPLIQIQDDFNDAMNAFHEVMDYGWPSTWINADDVEYEAIASQVAEPYGMRQKKVKGQQMQLEASFYREPDPQIPESFVNFNEWLQGPLAQFIIAAPPALFGGEMQDQKTASGYAQARAQAMGQLSLVWQAMQSLDARMYYQAALCASKNPDHSEEIIVPDDQSGQNVSVQLEKITKGKFGAFPDEDSSFPESMGAKRQQLSQLLEMAGQSPVGMQLFASPDNWEFFNQVLGFPELVLEEAEARNKQVYEIEILLQQSPIPPSPEEIQGAMVKHAADTMTAQASGGMPPPPMNPESMLKPSVPIEELDFHAYEGKKCQEWLSSEACRREQAAGNQPGVENVKLHAKAHLMMAAAMATPPPMAAPAPAGPKGPPKAKGEPGAPANNNASAPPGAPGTQTM